MTEPDRSKLSEAPRKRTREIFAKMDTNLDGVLSREEFLEGCLSDETLYNLLAYSSNDTL